MPVSFNTFLLAMAATAVIVFLSLYFVDAGYGKFYRSSWGPSLDNHLGWFLMEVPVFLAMLALWWFSDRRWDPARLVMLLLFETHYFHRSFIFPRQLRGHSRMPWSIVAMGALFNTLNAFMQGGWLFYVSPLDRYPASWLLSLPFLAGTALFLGGMYINIQSDAIIRNLRQPGDTRHYLPQGGMFRYVTSANYFGEWMEWTGFAILTWSWAGAVFSLWTFANLCPRADRIHRLYSREFPEQMESLKPKRFIPFIY